MRAICLLLPLLLTSAGSNPTDGKCLVDVEAQPARYFFFKDRMLPMTLEASERITHQLTSHVFAIFLRQVLGYVNVSVVSRRDAFNVSAVLSRLADGQADDSQDRDESNEAPEAMINLEVWIPQGYNLLQEVDSRNLEDCGALGPTGRLGWFMPQWTADKMATGDHWRHLRDASFTAVFDYDAHEMAFIDQFTRDSNQSYYCQDSFCQRGIFTPDQCHAKRHSTGPTCALLLADYTDYSRFVVDQIRQLDLLVRVVWLGPHADHVVSHWISDSQRRQSAKSVLFLSWRPSALTESGSFVSVLFPQCEIHAADASSCPYEYQQMHKIAWPHVREGAKLASEALQRVSFKQEDYRSLLHLYNQRQPDETPDQVACGWMRQNEAVWSQWKPMDLKAKTELYIGGIFPLTGPYYSDKGMVPAARMAVDAVNQNTSILKDYVLDLKVADGQCLADMVMKSFIDYIRFRHFNRMAGILGPACSDTVEPIAGVSKHFKTTVISYSAQGSTFSDRNKFPYFFRTIAESRQYKHVFRLLMKELGWKKVAALTEEGHKYADYISAVQDLVEKDGISFVVNRNIPNDAKLSMTQYLKDLRNKKVKIIIGEFHDRRARQVMCEAFHQNMTARHGYVWFLPAGFSPTWYDTDRLKDQGPKEKLVPCSTEEMIQAINGHLSLMYSNYAPNETIMQEGINVSHWRQKYVDECIQYQVAPSDYASYIYDAVWTYALALDKLLRQNNSLAADFHSDATTENLGRILNATDFTGVSGRVNFTGGPSRLSEIRVVQWIDKKLHEIGTFPPVADSNVKANATIFNKSRIVWLTRDGRQPVDEVDDSAICVLEGLAQLLHVECEVAIVVANILGFGIFASFLVLFFFFFKRRYERKVRQTEERMRALGLLSSGTLLTLDEWEIPRERIVINRKLGEGAFGTVYGGEAFFDDKGWVAVAVKTLKVGSTVEEKLDFLSEAEMMKRFNHKNIVKLLGVCTRNEPVYTVMEFILYGDLKTYLLARRHLVYEKGREDSDEISSRRLTNIALDIAKALSYLAELKYVHRDVACRNCLVNSNRVAKLADFGMARPMYENDYYRFHRKGMLPVRWMAPESLVDGLFTPMTDIWSYGVLLYEIITFGSFPFQGLSNNQVLEHVKNGMTIDIPDGVKPQLETLLKTCWHRTPSLRPQAAEIVELLTNNTRLVQPCVGIPLSSIQIEGTNSLEMQMPVRVTKSSSYHAKGALGGGKLNSFDLPPLSGAEHINDPLLSGFSGSNYVTQYITLQHGNNVDKDYISEVLEGVSSPV